MVQTEGSNVTLECLASGSPQPAVVWRREDGREIEINKNTTGGWWGVTDQTAIVIPADKYIPHYECLVCSHTKDQN